jgi:hypothetical protein
MAQRIPKWITQHAIKAGRLGLHEEIAVQLYHRWPNGAIDAVTYHSHMREFGTIERRAHYHIHLQGRSHLDWDLYNLMEFEIEHCRAASRPQSGKLKLFLREGAWERVLDYSSYPALLIEHRIDSYESRFGMRLEIFQKRVRCETIPFGDLSQIMDWEYLVQELIDRREPFPQVQA